MYGTLLAHPWESMHGWLNIATGRPSILWHEETSEGSGYRIRISPPLPPPPPPPPPVSPLAAKLLLTQQFRNCMTMKSRIAT